jgi:hypothetical protein
MGGFFYENDQRSMIRLLSFITCVCGLGIGIIAVVKGNITAETMGLCLGLVTAAITGKLIQKGQE